MAVRYGGMMYATATSAWTRRRSGASERAVAQASGAPSTTLRMPAPTARISVLTSGTKFWVRVYTRIRFPSWKSAGSPKADIRSHRSG